MVWVLAGGGLLVVARVLGLVVVCVGCRVWVGLAVTDGFGVLDCGC